MTIMAPIALSWTDIQSASVRDLPDAVDAWGERDYVIAYAHVLPYVDGEREPSLGDRVWAQRCSVYERVHGDRAYDLQDWVQHHLYGCYCLGPCSLPGLLGGSDG